MYTNEESWVLMTVGRDIFEKDNIDRSFEGLNFRDSSETFNLAVENPDKIINVLNKFESMNFVKIDINANLDNYSITMTPLGFIKWMEHFLELPRDCILISKALRNNMTYGSEIANHIERKKVVVYSILEYMEDLGYLKLYHDYIAQEIEIKLITPEGENHINKLLK